MEQGNQKDQMKSNNKVGTQMGESTALQEVRRLGKENAIDLPSSESESLA